MAVTPAHSTLDTFWILGCHLLLYRLSHRRKSVINVRPGETSRSERGGITTTRGCLFGFVRKKTAHAREINGKAVETTPPLMEPQETKEGQPPRFREDAKFD